MEPSHDIGQKQDPHLDRLLGVFCNQLLERAKSDAGGWEAHANKLTYSDELGRIIIDLQPEAAGSATISVTEERISGEQVVYAKRFANVGQVVRGHEHHVLCDLANAAIDGLGLRSAVVDITTRCTESMRRLADLPEIVQSGRLRNCTISSAGHHGGLLLIDDDNFRFTITKVSNGTRSGASQWRAEIESYYAHGPQTPEVEGVRRGIIERLFVWKPSAEGQIVNEMAKTLLRLYISHAC